MMPPLRVLILEPNRYRALLLQRALIAHFEDAVAARFDTVDSAIEEISRNIYAAVVLNLDIITFPQAEKLHRILSTGHRPGVVLLSSSESDESTELALRYFPDAEIVDSEDSVEQVVSAIRSSSSISQPAVELGRGGRANLLSHLSAAGQ